MYRVVDPMKALFSFALMAVALSVVTPARAAPDFDDAGKAASELGGALGGPGESSAESENPPAAGLIGTLTDKLGVTQRQAVGGSGALLGLAKNQLGGGQFDALTSQVPGISGLLGGGSGGGGLAGSMLGSVSSMSGVEGVFSSLGMSPDMIAQFAPVILDYFKQQGVGSGLLGSLGNLWGA